MKFEIDNDVILRQFMSREYKPGDILSQLEFIITVPRLLGTRTVPPEKLRSVGINRHYLPLPIEIYTGRVPENKVLPYVTSVVYNALVTIDRSDVNVKYNTKEFLKNIVDAKKETVDLLRKKLPEGSKYSFVVDCIENSFNEMIDFAKRKDIANTAGHRSIENDFFIDNEAIMFDCIYMPRVNEHMYVDVNHPTASLTVDVYNSFIHDNYGNDIHFLGNCVFIIGTELYGFKYKTSSNQRYFLLDKLCGSYYPQSKNLMELDWSFNNPIRVFILGSMLVYNKLLYGDSFIIDMDKKLEEMRKDHIALMTGQNAAVNAKSVLEMSIPSENYADACVQEAMESVYEAVGLSDIQNNSVDRMCNKAIDAIVDACSKINPEV